MKILIMDWTKRELPVEVTKHLLKLNCLEVEYDEKNHKRDMLNISSTDMFGQIIGFLMPRYDVMVTHRYIALDTKGKHFSQR